MLVCIGDIGRVCMYNIVQEVNSTVGATSILCSWISCGECVIPAALASKQGSSRCRVVHQVASTVTGGPA